MKTVQIKVECNQPLGSCAEIRRRLGTHRFQRAGVDRSTLGGPAAPGADSYSCAFDSNQCASCRDCTLEAMRTQACANQCMDFKGLLFAQSSFKSEQSRLVLYRRPNVACFDLGVTPNNLAQSEMRKEVSRTLKEAFA